jgi:anti-sigma regulatory factor (Ser/Thr protein kinase)
VSRQLTYSRAGHVPAVLAAPQSAATVLSGAGSVPLGVQRNHRPQASVVLAPRSTLMLFTDGLVERRGESIDAGIARVAGVLTQSVDAAIDDVAEEVLREMAPPGGYDDDIAIVVCRPPLVTLRIENDAAPDQLAPARKQLTAWLGEIDVPDGLVGDVVLAVGEACANCVEHAYHARPPGTMRVEAEVEGDEIRIRVVDFGIWRTPTSQANARGRGLVLMRSLSDVVHLDSTGAGTTVAISFRLPRR